MSEKIYWIDADGGQIDLTDGVKYNVLQGVDGRFMPPFEMVTSEAYGLGGDYVRLRKTKPREITLPIIVYGTSESDTRNNLRILTAAFDPTKDDGKLKVVTPDSKTLLINCHYSGGMSFSETTDTGTCTFRKFVATFLCHDPYWYNALENELILHGSYSAQGFTIDNDGDVDTWPLWTISGGDTGGPVTIILLQNLTTGKSFNFTGINLASRDDTLVIDTRRSSLYAWQNFYYNYFTFATINSSLFPLVPGINQLYATITGADIPATLYIKCRWIDKYNGV